MSRASSVNWMLGVIAAAVFISATFANAATQAFYVTVEGTKQGQFKGESTREAFKNKIEAIGFSFEVTSPRDAATGQASGKRSYKPLSITKPIGGASPQLFQALTTNEVLKQVMLEFVKTNANGEEYIYYTIKLTNATVASVRQFTPSAADDAKHANAGSMPQMEEISFSFQKIEMENKDSKMMAVDDWHAK